MEHTRSILMHEYDSQSALNDCDAEDEHQMEFVSAIWTASIFQVFDQCGPLPSFQALQAHGELR